MELASRVYDVVTDPENIHPEIKDKFPEVNDSVKSNYWKEVIRMAALCHDLGHIPFSHAAEKELMEEGCSHETFTANIINELEEIWQEMTPPLRTDDIKKLAVGPKELPDLTFSDWESILTEIITGDSFGVDRIDYLLRDSYHAGVAYGNFDHFRLIDTLRILPKEYAETEEPALGIEIGGIHTAESLLLARYYMFTQVYMHRVRRIYDIHLKDFMKSWLVKDKITDDLDFHLNLTDNNILVAMREALNNEDKPGHKDAKRILERNHFKVLYSPNPGDMEIHIDPNTAIYEAAKEEFGEENVRADSYHPTGGTYDFPVLLNNGEIESSVNISDVLNNIPVVKVDFVFINSDFKKDADEWLEANKKAILKEDDI